MATHAVLADTHTLVWWLFEPHNLSAAADQALQEAENHGDPIFVATITVVELCYLTEKNKLPGHYLQDTLTLLEDPLSAVTPVEFAIAHAKSLLQIPRLTVPEMPDRIIAATAFELGIPLVTRDHKIQALTNITTIW